MARGFKTGGRVAKEKEPDPDEQAAIDAQANERAADELADVEDEGQRSPECRIHRIDPDDGKQKFLSVAPPGQVSDRYLQRKYGGGEYVTETYATLKGGRFGYVKGSRKTYNIDTSIPFKGAGVSGPVMDSPRRDDDDGDMRYLMKNQIMDTVREQADARQQTAMMMMNMMKTMSESSAAMITAISSMASNLGRAPAADTGTQTLLTAILPALLGRKDPTEIAATLMTLMKPATGGIEGLGGFEAILEIADRLNKRANGDEDGNISMAGVIKDNLPKALDLFSAYAAQRPAVAPPAPRITATAGQPSNEVAAPAGATPIANPPVTQDEWTDVEPYVPQLVQFAENDADPHGVMMTVLTLAPGPFKARIRNLVATDDAAEKILARFPVLQPYRVWTAQLLDEFRAEFFGGDDDDLPPETPADGTDRPAVE